MTITNPMFPPPLVPAASPTSRRSILFGLAAGVVASPAVASSLRPAVTAPAAETALSGLAPAVAAPSEVDPVFAAIKAEREAYAPYCITRAVQRRISDQDPSPPQVRYYDEKANAERLAQPAHKAWWAKYKKAEVVHIKTTQEWVRTREEFLQTRPTTAAGLRAFVEHIDGPFTHGEAGEAFWDEDEKALAFPTLAAAVRDLLIGGAQS
jgi:hypothetical protein